MKPPDKSVFSVGGFFVRRLAQMRENKSAGILKIRPRPRRQDPCAVRRQMREHGAGLPYFSRGFKRPGALYGDYVQIRAQGGTCFDVFDAEYVVLRRQKLRVVEQRLPRRGVGLTRGLNVPGELLFKVTTNSNDEVLYT